MSAEKSTKTSYVVELVVRVVVVVQLEWNGVIELWVESRAGEVLLDWRYMHIMDAKFRARYSLCKFLHLEGPQVDIKDVRVGITANTLES